MRLDQQDLLTRFEDYLRFERRFSLHTVDSYIRDCSQLLDYLQKFYKVVELEEIASTHLRSWAVQLIKAKSQATSVRRKLSAIAHFFKWLRRERMISGNPIARIQLPKIPERLPKSLPSSAIKKLWELMESDQVPGYSTTRDKALIGLLYGCGLRRSEVIALKWSDYDISRNTLRVYGKGRKYRQVPVPGEVKKALEALKNLHLEMWKDGQVNVILRDSGEPCYPKFVHNRVVSLLGKISTAEKRSPHILRHSMATHLMDEGAELNAVKALLGHSSLAATQVYTHNSISRLREIYKQSHPNAKRNAE